jgi:hypothetical protein
MTDDDLTQQLLVGTWVGIAIVIEALVEEGLIKRKAILKPLSAAEAVREDKSEHPLRVIQTMVRQGVIKAS